MEQHKCAFSGALITNQFNCEHATSVVRRAGPDVACQSATAHIQCELLFQCLKTAALPVFGFEDDLLSMPHSVLMKIQLGGLSGLQRVLDGGAQEPVEVNNIHDTLERAIGKYGSLDAVPCGAFAEEMASYQLKRRRS